ncbi:hypothetical protein DRN45_04770 [Thermococci archaeon]|nr:MAG: hypothetical protein DRN45_04770 [Thermococci archaeon]
MLYTEGYEMEIEMLLYAFICLIFLIFSSFFYSKWKKSEVTSFLFLMLWCLFSALQIVYIVGKYTDMLFFVKISMLFSFLAVDLGLFPAILFLLPIKKDDKRDLMIYLVFPLLFLIVIVVILSPVLKTDFAYTLDGIYLVMYMGITIGLDAFVLMTQAFFYIKTRDALPLLMEVGFLYYLIGFLTYAYIPLYSLFHYGVTLVIFAIAFFILPQAKNY